MIDPPTNQKAAFETWIDLFGEQSKLEENSLTRLFIISTFDEYFVSVQKVSM